MISSVSFLFLLRNLTSFLSVHTLHQADVFSFAIMLFEVVARDIPYRAQYKAQTGAGKVKKQKIMKKVRKGELRPGPLTDAVWTPQLKDIMTRCWAQDARARPSFVEVVKTLTHLISAGELGESEKMPADVGNGSQITTSSVGSISNSMGDTTKAMIASETSYPGQVGFCPTRLQFSVPRTIKSSGSHSICTTTYVIATDNCCYGSLILHVEFRVSFPDE